jgi:hypothetical protein
MLFVLFVLFGDLCPMLPVFSKVNFQNPIFAQWVISLNLVLARLRLGLKNRQVGKKWVSDDCSYLCKG